MPKRDDLHHVLVIGSGPILIGQAAEFDYSGTQACRVLRAEGLRVSLVNSKGTYNWNNWSAHAFMLPYLEQKPLYDSINFMYQAADAAGAPQTTNPAEGA